MPNEFPHRAIEEMGWLLPTPIQQEAIPLILGGGDVMAAAETGSDALELCLIFDLPRLLVLGTGKTGAFGLPALQVCLPVRLPCLPCLCLLTPTPSLHDCCCTWHSVLLRPLIAIGISVIFISSDRARDAAREGHQREGLAVRRGAGAGLRDEPG